MKILLARSGGLGDSALTLPVVYHIKEKNPRGRVAYAWKQDEMLDVARLSGYFKGFHSIDESGFANLYSDSNPSEFIKSFFSNFNEVYYFSSAKKEIISQKIISSGVKKCHVMDPRPPKDRNSHIVEHLLKIYYENNTSNSYIPNNYRINNPTFSQTEKRKRNGLVIHPGSGSLSKNWPIERFITVGKKQQMPVTFHHGAC